MRKMKDSGLAWVGCIPDSWCIQRNKTLFSCSKEIVGATSELETLLSLTTQGIRTKSKDISGGKVPESFDTYQKVQPNDIVMCLFDLDCSAVFSGKSDFEGMISPAYKVLKCKPGITPQFADYWFRFVFDGRKFKPYSKNLRYTLNYDEFAGLPIIVPPVEQQRHITSFLDAECEEIDALIGRTRESIAEYRKMRNAVIAEAITKGVRGKRAVKESGLEWVPELPVEWTTIPSKFLFRNSDLRKQPDDEQLTASQKYGIISQREYMERENTKIVLANKGLEDWKHVEPYDFVISLRSFQGGLEMSETTGCITWHYIVLKPCKPIVNKYFKWLFKSEIYIKALQRTCNFIRDGQDLRYSNFVQVPLFEPPLDEQKEIADYLDQKCAEIDDLIAKKERFLVELENYKKALIYEYVTGKKEVPVPQSETVSVVYPYFPAVLNTDKRRFAQAILMCRILDKCRKKMGRVKLEKMLYTIESSIGFDLETEYVREAAGPLDVSDRKSVV